MQSSFIVASRTVYFVHFENLTFSQYSRPFRKRKLPEALVLYCILLDDCGLCTHLNRNLQNRTSAYCSHILGFQNIERMRNINPIMKLFKSRLSLVFLPVFLSEVYLCHGSDNGLEVENTTLFGTVRTGCALWKEIHLRACSECSQVDPLL
jgi:hypothetical protein